MKRVWATIKEAVRSFGRHKVPRLAAALAYYTLFSLAPLLVIIIAVVGLIFGTEEARAQLVSQLEGAVGPESAELVGTMIDRTQQSGSGVLATVIGVGTLLLGATGIAVQLQRALNEIWEAPLGARRGFVRTILLRLEALLMVLGLGLAAMLAVALQGALGVITSSFEELLPGASWLWFLANIAVSLAILTLVFAALFKLVPDVKLRWNEVWRGALFTAALTMLGQVALGIYLGTAGVRSAYGAAGSLVVLVLYVYYAWQILLFGAEFTRADAQAKRRDKGESERFERKG